MVHVEAFDEFLFLLQFLIKYSKYALLGSRLGRLYRTPPTPHQSSGPEAPN